MRVAALGLIEGPCGQRIELGAVLLKDFTTLDRAGVKDLMDDPNACLQLVGDEVLFAGRLGIQGAVGQHAHYPT